MTQNLKILKIEVESAIKKFSDGKAPGFDAISAEEIKGAGETGFNIFFNLCNQKWETDKFLETGERPSLRQFIKRKIIWIVEITEV